MTVEQHHPQHPQHAQPDGDVAGPVDLGASMELSARARAALHASVPALVEDVRLGKRKIAFTFAGQGAACIDEIAELHAAGGAPRKLLEVVRHALVDELHALDAAEADHFPHGIDFLAWLSSPASRPDEATLARASSSAPLLLAAQMARVEQMLAHGLDAIFDAVDVEYTDGARVVAAGHSQGVLGAIAFSSIFGVRDAAERARTVSRIARAALHLGIAMERSGVPAAPPSSSSRSLADTGMAPTPMAGVGGLDTRELRALIDASGADGVVVAVANAPFHHTIAGAPAALERVRRFMAAKAEEQRAAKKRGQAPGRAPEVRFAWLPVSGPFHTPMFTAALDELVARLAARALHVDAEALRVPVTAAALPARGDVLGDAMASILVRPQDWRGALADLVSGDTRGSEPVDVVIDCGPGADVAHLTGSALRGRGVAVLPAVEPATRAAILDPKRAPAAPAPFSSFAPRVDEATGAVRNKFVDATGCPPVLVPGMTPTTVEADIVVAAANAGFVAELAGGGQVTAPIFRARMDEVRQKLAPGAGVVFNALYLDPYLWNLHFKKDRIVFKLRDEGYPILGVTVSAGVPPLEEATALLDELVAHGMTLNAFKPGNDRQLDEVIAIAKARPQMTIFAHIEGGKAGGHHSWEDLDDLLVRHYAKLRACENLVVCVGGGVGTEAQARAYLHGTWSTSGAFAGAGLPPMPVDAVFLGTRLMSTLEAKTSPAVKAALVRAAGAIAQWPKDGGAAAGGVVSGKSSLDAPIYYLDNAAARCGRLLDEVAGDAAKVQAKRDAIVAALAGTAKPYFGDVEAMTPAELLARARALLTPDGVDVDPTWRSRVRALAERCAARYGDDLGSSLVHPDDALFFLEVCKRPGKPVPFVPVIDADVRRWFKSDSLWQSHDERYAADAVFSIPGPAAVAAIRAADEPVAEVLASFAQAALPDGGHAAAPAARRWAGRAQPALSAPFVVDEDGRWHGNPLLGLPASCARMDGAVLRAEVRHGDAALDLCLALVHDSRGGFLRFDRKAFLRAQHAFYSRAIFGDVVEAVPLFGEAREPVVVSTDRVRAFRSATADDGDDGAADVVPLSMSFSLAWRAIFRALAGAEPDVLHLVHESDTSERAAGAPALRAGAALEAVARVRSVDVVEGGTRVTIDAALEDGQGAPCVRTVSQFFIRGSIGATPSRREDRAVRAKLAIDEAAARFLLERGFAGAELLARAQVGGAVAVELDARVAGGRTRGTLTCGEDRVGDIDGGTDVADKLVELFGEAAADRAALEAPAPLGKKIARAPRQMTAYADASGDRNPLHVDEQIARLAGFQKPIVHGMWTSSWAAHRIARLAADGDGARVTRVSSTFTAPVSLRAQLTLEARVVSKRRGASVIEADVVDGDGVVVMKLAAEVAPKRTAYVFPGQGVQHAGMGMEAYARSAAARAVWDEADAVCRRKHGFSLLHVVRDNPRELWVNGERLVHPEGVLFLTQLTQVALAVMAVADVRELEERSALVDGARYAGHSLGEYSALASVPRVMPLEGVVDIVYERGRTMDRLVARDATGRSPYAMGAVRPNLAGLDEDAALALVDAVAAEAGAPLFVVNHNVRGRQYAVTGDVRALAVLKKRLNERSAGKPAFVDVPGIDVPFHSPLLRDGVALFRARLEAVLPERVDPALLEDRYVPNLTGTVFRLERGFLEEVAAASSSPRVAEWLACFADVCADRARFARMLLVEVLAYQFASPVRWIDCQAALLAEPAVDLVEVGPARQPVLVGMARAASIPEGARVLHAALDRDAVLGTLLVEEDAAPAAPAPAAAPASSSSAAVAASAPAPAPALAPAVATTPIAADAAATAAAALPEPGPWAEDALVTLLCVLTKKARADVDMSRSLDHLLGGNSARRNQVLAEIGAELGGRAVDNAHEMPLAALASTIAKVSNAQGPGPVLKPLQDQAAHKLLGHDLGKLDDVVARDYGLSPAHRERLKNRLAVRAKLGGDKLDVDTLVREYGAELGVTVGKKSAQAAGAAVDSAALDALEARVLGNNGALARVAGALLDAVDPQRLDGVPALAQDAKAAADDREHDDAYFAATRGVFDGKKHVAYTSAWAWARRDLLDDAVAPDIVARRLDPAGRRLAAHLRDEALRDRDAARAARLDAILAAATAPGAFAGRTALVTGAGPGSIARAVVARLLAGGARVVVTTSRPDAARSFKPLYQEHAALGAELHVIPANQGSFADVDDLVRFLAEPKKERSGSVDKIVKAPMVPDLLIPFGAVSETADLSSMGPRSLTMFRVLVLGVERLVARLAELHAERGSRLQVVLPLSPNHGTFGGDGAYGECKAALEALLEKQRSERWGKSAAVVGARIGWVRGTGLMHQNDGAAAFFEARGLKTFSSDEMADLLVELARVEAQARTPFVEDLTGGLGAVPNLAALLAEHHAAVAHAARVDKKLAALRERWPTSSSPAPAPAPAAAARQPRQRLAVPVPTSEDLARLPQLDHLDLDELVVVVGTGEVSPWGSARTRWAMERDAKLSLEAVLELAWMMGLVVPDEKGAGFLDAKTKERVTSDDVVARYEEHVLAHAGVRVIEPEVVGFDPNKVARLIEVRLDRDFKFPVPTREIADALVAEDPAHTVVVTGDGGALFAVRRAGGIVRVPAALAVHRKVAGQIPSGWDATRFGVPKELVAQVDPVTLYCLVSTAEAFLAAGLTPDELFAHLHPSRAGVTIGTGIGGMTKLKRLYRDFYDGADRQNDALQETLINVIGGYVVQSFLGGYGPMSFPVGACATGGLSLSEAVDKIKTGQADLVVAGGADDLSEAGNIGFGDMGATADTDDLAARGVEPRFMSRPSDARRRGFVESQGAGVVVVCRASLAVKLALPVYGVVAFAGSSGDGLQKSVPAPGQGALALAAEDREDRVDHTACDLDSRRRQIREVEKRRSELAALFGPAQADALVASEKRRLAHDFAKSRADISPLRAALAVLGLGADDVGVISKHDSSTQANDLNEARLYETLMTTLGRAPHKPLHVISQKSLTGHPKGAAAAWQMNGLMQAMADGAVPGNLSLDDVDDDMRQFPRLVWSDRARRLPWHQMKAGVVTTLGFGHVSALVVLAHPFLFWRALDDDTRADYARRMEARRRAAEQRLQRVLSGRAPLFVPRERPSSLSAAEEARVLTDLGARLPPSSSSSSPSSPARA